MRTTGSVQEMGSPHPQLFRPIGLERRATLTRQRNSLTCPQAPSPACFLPRSMRKSLLIPFPHMPEVQTPSPSGRGSG